MERAETNSLIGIIQELDKKRIAATLAADEAVLEGILADELIWTHASGNSDTKAEWMAKVIGGKVRYHSITLDESKYREYAGTVIVNGKGSTSVMHHGGIDTFKMSITAVYAKSGSTYRLVTMQVTKLV